MTSLVYGTRNPSYIFYSISLSILTFFSIRKITPFLISRKRNVQYAEHTYKNRVTHEPISIRTLVHKPLSLKKITSFLPPKPSGSNIFIH